MEENIELFLFGDQTDDARSDLRALLCTELDPLLESFINKSYLALRTELLEYLKVEHTRNLTFSNLLELLEVRIRGPQQVSLDHAITTICQFALFFRRCQKSRGLYPKASSTGLIGLCTGSLAAAAISCCKSPAELLSIAVEVSVLSFRAGALASETGQRLCCHAQCYQSSWAVALPGIEEIQANELLDTVIRRKGLPLASRPYVGVVSKRGVTICGPPHVLKALHTEQEFANKTLLSLPVCAPYHASHLYGSDDINFLLNQTITEWYNYTQSIPVISNKERRMDLELSLRDALFNALRAIFLERVDWGKIIRHSKSVLRSCPQGQVSIIPVASGAAQSLCQALKLVVEKPITMVEPPVGPQPSDGDTKNVGQSTSRSKIAIVGASGRFPSADTVSEFWELLLRGLDVHKVVPSLRWDARTHVDTSEKPRKNTSATPYGCWLDNAGLFDARFFGMSPREAEQVDPAQRLALMTAYEALEDGGIIPGSRSTQSDRVGVAYGVTSNDWMETNSAQDIDTFLIPGGNRAFIPGRINYFFKFSGPSYSIDTACSSSLAAIHIACNALWRGEADTMIAGGTNILTNPDFTAGLDRGRFLSRTGNCKTFDNEADGYCRGEGVGSVILKRLEDAIADGDLIKAVIVNVCTNHSAESESITRPHLKAQRHIFTKVLDGRNANSVSYVEMHGTGTQVGDATEMLSVLEAVAPANGTHRRSEKELVHIGSVKSNVGHGEAAAGVTSLIKLLLMMQYNTIPPHCGIKSRINQKFPPNIHARGVRIAAFPIVWNRNGRQPRSALLNNFSAAGGNTTLLLEDAPFREQDFPIDSATAQRSTYPIAISAKTVSALQASATALVRFIQQNPDLDVASLSYTTMARRMHHAHRIAISGSSLQDIVAKLSTAVQSGTGKSRSLTQCVIFAFTGQGGYYAGMGRELYDTNAAFRNDIDKHNRVAVLQGFSSFISLIRNKEGDILTFDAVATQLAILSLQMALAKFWISCGIVPSSVIGHSLGHYAALCTAGVISETDAIFIVGTRARLLQERCQPGTHRMLAVKARTSIVTNFLAGTSVEVACINGPDDTILSGLQEHIELVRSRLISDKIRTVTLDVPYAFHSSQMDCAMQDFRSFMAGVAFCAPKIPVLCPRTEQVVRDEGIFGPAHLVDHLRRSVNFVAAVEAARHEKIITEHTLFVEIGHNSTVTTMLQAILNTPSTGFPSLKRNHSAWNTITDALTSLYMAGFDVRWQEYYRDLAQSCSVISLPHYKWDLKNYWLKYVNDWSLRKGDTPQLGSAGGPSLLSTTIHSVISEELGGQQGTIILRSDLSRPELHLVSQGHKVNGLPLCTPSIYTDIALTVGMYLQESAPSLLKGKQICIDDMIIDKALIAQPIGPQWLQTTITVDHEHQMKCVFSTVDDDGNVVVRHSSCTITYAPFPSTVHLREQARETHAAISQLHEGLATGKCYRFNAAMIYRMVATLADFDRGYRGLKEIVLDSKAMAAAARIDFSAMPPKRHDEVYSAHPAYVDSLSQSAGFVMNANEASDLDVECFVNHGWKSFRLYEALKTDRVYQSFVQMNKVEGSIWKGTLTVVDNEDIVAVFDELTLQGVAPRLLHHVLSSANKVQSKTNHDSSNDLSFDFERHLKSRDDSGANPGGKADFELALSQVVDIVTEESGIDKVDLHDHMELVDIGIDSLLSLLITSRLKEDLDFDIGSGLSIFDRFNTLGELKAGYAAYKGLPPYPASGSSGSEHPPVTKTPDSRDSGITLENSATALDQESILDIADKNDLIARMEAKEASARPVTSIVLQHAAVKSIAEDRITLFLFPDGSGSASSYAALPQISPQVTLIGLICPYRKDPEAMTCSLDALILSYVTEVKRRQPKGPYVLGGWSSGGVFAYRAAQMLLDAGSVVRDLILIDSPPPNDGLERLPEKFYKHCSDVGVFNQIGGGTAEPRGRSNDLEAAGKAQPEWLIPHFNATIDLLSSYRAAPLSIPRGVDMPRVALSWAGECALDGTRYGKLDLEEDDGEGVRFLAERRTDFGPGKWSELLLNSMWQVETIKGWDHFSMMYGEGAKALCDFLERVLVNT